MTEISAIGAVNAGIVRDSVQNEEQQFAKQQAQIKGEAEEFAQRRVEQSQAGANDAGDNPGAEDLDFSSDDVQLAQVDDSLRLEAAQNAVQEQVQEDQAVQVSLSDAALDAQNQANACDAKCRCCRAKLAGQHPANRSGIGLERLY